MANRTFQFIFNHMEAVVEDLFSHNGFDVVVGNMLDQGTFNGIVREDDENVECELMDVLNMAFTQIGASINVEAIVDQYTKQIKDALDAELDQ